MRKPRKARPKQKNVPKGYDSRWEYDIHKSILKKWEHHKSEVIQYTVTHTYEPDFVKTIGRKVILLEAKGRFWDYAEYSKYVWIRKSLPKHVELVFYFKNHTLLCPRQRNVRTERKEPMLNGLKKIILNGIVKKLYQRSGKNELING